MHRKYIDTMTSKFYLPLCLLVLLCCSILVAAGPKKAKVRSVAEVVQRRSSVRGAATNAETLLGLEADEDAVRKQAAKVNGRTQIKYQQYYKGYPVYGTLMVLEKDSDGKFTDFGLGELVDDLDEALKDVSPKLTSTQAENISFQAANKKRSEVKQIKHELKIYVPAIAEDSDTDGDAGDESGVELSQAVLTYFVSFFYEGNEEVHAPTYIIDADNGKVWDFWDEASYATTRKISGFGGNKKLGTTPAKANRLFDADHLGGMLVTVVDDGTGKNCILKNKYAKTYDCKNTRICPTKPVAFKCDEGIDECGWKKNATTCNGGFSTLSEAHYGVTRCYEMFDKVLKSYGSENTVKTLMAKAEIPFPVQLKVRYYTDWENAYYYGAVIGFGQGAKTTHPYTVLDIACHEVAHGITKAASNIRPTGQAGAIWEAFSDMAGKRFEKYVTKQNNWKFGNDVYKKGIEPGYVRDMEKSPGDGLNVDCSTDWTVGDYYGYEGMGIYTKAFTRLANDIGIETAFKVFMYANEMYWSEAETFFPGAKKVKTAAKVLGVDVKAVQKAFLAACIKV